MLSLSSLSRRALVAVAALAAVAPKVEAGSTPQAFVIATLSDPQTPDPDQFSLLANAALNHPESGLKGRIGGLVYVDTRASADRARKQIVSQLKDYAVTNLKINNVTVAKDRVSVVLL